MDLFNPKSSIDIIFGPMFSGKTTELIRRLTIFNEAGMKVVYINSSYDTRDALMSTHNKSLVLNGSQKFETLKTFDLTSIMPLIKEFDVIGIDEAQFFKDLKRCSVEMAETLNKKVIISGLNGDFQREAFGEINALIPLCDNITKLYPFCLLCRDLDKLSPALFSKRLDQSARDVICIGANDKYVPVCRECYGKPNDC